MKQLIYTYDDLARESNKLKEILLNHLAHDGVLAEGMDPEELAKHYVVIVNEPSTFGSAIKKYFGEKDDARFMILRTSNRDFYSERNENSYDEEQEAKPPISS